MPSLARLEDILMFSVREMFRLKTTSRKNKSSDSGSICVKAQWRPVICSFPTPITLLHRTVSMWRSFAGHWIAKEAGGIGGWWGSFPAALVSLKVTPLGRWGFTLAALRE